ncbi:MAG: helix-turn-helix transcriptional regulator [Halioglobus sp.]
MKAARRKQLERHGWIMGSSSDFLGLSQQDAAYIEMKIALSHKLKSQRLRKKLSQREAASLLNCCQSRIARMESGDPGTSIDQLIRSLMALGVPPKLLARTIAKSG